MLKKIGMVLCLVCFCFTKVCASNSYIYANWCPSGHIFNKCVDGNKDGIFDNKPCEYYTTFDGGYFVDRWGFAQCQCTSYVAYRLNNPMDDPGVGGDTDSIYGIPFNNHYLGQHWGDGGQWGAAARRAGIPVDGYPIPGDVVYFKGGNYGHVAYIESVEYDGDMKIRSSVIIKECYVIMILSIIS